MLSIYKRSIILLLICSLIDTLKARDMNVLIQVGFLKHFYKKIREQSF